MATIVFFVNPNVGSPIASMKLAADLKTRGHRIRFLGLEDSRDDVVSNGFEFIPVFTRHFPKGLLEEYSVFDTLPVGIRYLCAMRKLALRFRAFFDDLLSEGGREFLALLKSLEPDLMVFASGAAHMEWLAIFASSLGIKGVYLNDMLTPGEAQGHPPYSSDLVPTATPGSRLEIYLSWKKFRAAEYLDDLLKELMAGASWRRFSRKLAEKHGYGKDFRSIPENSERLLRLPEVFAFPAAFDFPGPDLPGRYYTEASIYLERSQVSFAWDELEEDRPVLYCALGSVVPFSTKAKTLYLSMIRASTIRPEWKWVISVGNNNDPGEFGPLPDNVLLVKSAPQLEILKRAKIVITHGGANTIKECIYFGVPMIVFPFMAERDTDQPGNAARVAYHGLGLQGDHRKVGDVDYIKRLIERVDKDPFIKTQIKFMQTEFRKAESDQLCLKLIERFLAV